MKKSISKIRIYSKYFDPSVELCLFEKDSRTNDIAQISLIYGQNGTGKTTIAKALANLKIKDNIEIKMELFDYFNNPINLTEHELKEIFVYNDDFMENKVRFRYEDKIGVIVMLGEQVDIDNQILAKKSDIKKITSEIGKLKIEDYENEKSVKSPKYHLAKIREQLANTWAEREKSIQNNSRRSPVSEKLVQDAIVDKSAKDINIEKNKYNEILNQYTKVKNIKDDFVAVDFSNNKSIEINTDSIKNILDLIIQKPIESEMSKKIKYAFDKYNIERIKEIERFFKEKDVPFCPFCFREYDDNEAVAIIDEISKLINQEYNKLITDIDRSIIPDLSIEDLTHLTMISSDLISKYYKAIDSLSGEIKRVNEALETKKNNPYTSLLLKTTIEQDMKNLRFAIKEIEDEVNLVNESVKNKKDIFQEIQNQNKRLAFAECKTQIKTYATSLKEFEKVSANSKQLNAELHKLDREIAILESKKENAELAIEKINKWLSLIFLDSQRLSLVYENGKYAVKCRGKDIKMKDLSNGERNAVGLSYFFASINEKKSGDSYSDVPKLIVLDDPLSSFDFENKLGIYSFLKSIFSDVVVNDDSKILVLTHQLDTMFSMNQMLQDANKLKNRKCQQLLVDKGLKTFNGNVNIYHRLLLEVGDFLSTTFNEDVSSLPNKVRRVLESFSTFNFGCGMAQLSTKDSITQNIKNLKIREYLKDSMYRITLNNESHLENQSKGIEEGMLMYFEDITALSKAIKDILLLIMELNESHFLEIFKSKNNVIQEIKLHREHIIEIL